MRASDGSQTSPHRRLGSSYLVAHVLRITHYPPPPREQLCNCCSNEHSLTGQQITGPGLSFSAAGTSWTTRAPRGRGVTACAWRRVGAASPRLSEGRVVIIKWLTCYNGKWLETNRIIFPTAARRRQTTVSGYRGPLDSCKFPTRNTFSGVVSRSAAFCSHQWSASNAAS